MVDVEAADTVEDDARIAALASTVPPATSARAD